MNLQDDVFLFGGISTVVKLDQGSALKLAKLVLLSLVVVSVTKIFISVWMTCVTAPVLPVFMLTTQVEPVRDVPMTVKIVPLMTFVLPVVKKQITVQ